VVHLGAAEIEIHVEGDGLNDMIVELASDEPGPTVKPRMNGLRYSSFHYGRSSFGRLGGSEALLGMDYRKFLNWPNTLCQIQVSKLSSNDEPTGIARGSR